MTITTTKKGMFFAAAGILAACLAGGAAFLSAADGEPSVKGALEGVVSLPDGNPYPNACCLLLIKDGQKEPVAKAITKDDGAYRFSDIAVGQYKLRVHFDGFAKMDIAVRLFAGSHVKKDIRLQPEFKEETRVVADKPAAETSARLQSMSAEQVEQLPSVGGDFRIIGARASSPAPPPAHGGTAPPNAAAFDATFFENYGVNPFIDAEDDRFSTFAVDVDTASYTVARSYLDRGVLPPKDSVRVEEFVNFFNYGYEPPRDAAFAVYAEGAPSKFGGPKHKLLRLAIQGRKVSPENRQDAVLTFVIDVSGSMEREDRLELVKKALHLLLDELTPRDRVGIVVYGSDARIALEHTGVENRDVIKQVMDGLYPGGSTYAEAGLRLGYAQAERAFRKGAINRVILCSDGVANVGQTGAEEILRVIRSHVERGITLSALGFGMENFNDVLLEKLGDKGDGHYAYVDTLAEAKRIFVENLTGTLQVIARDVKVQVDFNPAVVKSYRLLGYENRDVADEKFRDDKEDGGEIGSGHSVTALYELKFHDEVHQGPVASVHVRWKARDKNESAREFSHSVTTKDFKPSFEAASPSFRLASAAAEFAEVLRKSYWANDGDLGAVLDAAQAVQPFFKRDARAIEFADMVSKAHKLVEEEKRAKEKAERARGDSEGRE